MSDQPQASAGTTQSGGVNIQAGDTAIGRDVIGRDKIETHIHYHYATASKDQPHPAPLPQGRQRVFISYKRGAQPDESLALHLYERLSQHHDVFIDQEIIVGTEWRKRIQSELETCDFLVSLLSEQSAHSEMVEYEISTAHHLKASRGGRPSILPVRIAYGEPFDYPLGAYLNHINWTAWKSEADTVRLTDELLVAIAGGELSLADVMAKAAVLDAPTLVAMPRPRAFADPAKLERPEGTMDPESHFYIERPGDEVCQREMERQGATIAIKAPRQMGKSSLLIRATGRAQQAGKAVAFLDFQLLDEGTLHDPTAFFKGLCHWIVDELGLDDHVEEFWQQGLGNVQLCTKYVRRRVLGEMASPVVLVMDEVDRMLNCPFHSDFFGMLRNWHNSRRSGNEWQRLDFLLVISTEPYLLIDDLKQSPFNVGEVIRLDDFTPEQVADLNERHGRPFSEPQLARLIALVGGHPYLVRQAMYRVAVGEYPVEAFFAKATDEHGPFGDHLRRHLTRFNERPELAKALRQVLAYHTGLDDLSFYRLHGAGLVRRTGSQVALRCELYAAYFRDHLENA